MNPFAFDMREKVILSLSRERGEVIGRAEYADIPPQYFVRYLTADGRQQENWFTSGALTAD